MDKVICMCPGTLGTGGIGTAFLNLSKEFCRRGATVDFFLTDDSDDRVGRIPKDANLYVGSRRARYSILDMISYLKDRKPDILFVAHEHIILMSILATFFARTGTRLVPNIQTNTSVDKMAKSRVYRGIVRVNRWLFRYTDCIVAVSQGVAEDTLKDGVRGVPIEVIYNPSVTTEILRQADEPVDHPWLKGDRDGPVLLSAGRLTEQKDYPTLLRAFRCFRHHHNGKLIILGEGEDKSDLLDLSRNLSIDDDVDFAGYVNNPVAYMAKANVFVLSSAWEGSPNVLKEAMCAGTQIVSTDCPSGPFEILDGGRYGRLVPVRDHQALCSALEAAYEDPLMNARRLRERAMCFHVERIADEYLALFDRL